MVPAGAARARLLLVVMALGVAPGTARADWLVTPFLGGTFAGRTALPDLEQGAGSTQFVVGGAAGWWSAGILALDADFAYAPRFFERDNSTGLVTNSNVMTLGLSVAIATPVSVSRESLRPYVIGGVGWMHASIEERQNLFPEIFGRAKNSVGVNVGAGAIGFVTPRTGVRFDLRHFRSLERDMNPLSGERMALLSFWRATVGVVIRR